MRAARVLKSAQDITHTDCAFEPATTLSASASLFEIVSGVHLGLDQARKGTSVISRAVQLELSRCADRAR